jgi:mono/diheme cytochrome c family protein
VCVHAAEYRPHRMIGGGSRAISRWVTVACCICRAVFPSCAPIIPRSSATSETWHTPRSCIFTPNPVPATTLSIAKGGQTYRARCMGCHGASGHGDGPDATQLRVRPARLSGRQVQEQSDGLLWRKITFGKAPMPGYRFRLSPTDRWHVVNYLRTLSDNKPARSKAN